LSNYLAYLVLDGWEHAHGCGFQSAGRCTWADGLAFSNKVGHKLAATSDACVIPDCAGNVLLL
jgi:sarcosine oxidase delta subunit